MTIPLIAMLAGRLIPLTAPAASPAEASVERASREITFLSGRREIHHGHCAPGEPVYLGAADDHVIVIDRATGKHMRGGGGCIVSWDVPTRRKGRTTTSVHP